MKKLSKLSTILLYIIIIGIIFSFILTKYFANKIEPSISRYASSEVKRIITLIINDSINTEISKNMDLNTIFEIERDENNDIKMLDLNTNNVNKILNSFNQTIQYNIKQVEQGKIRNIDKYLNGVSDIDYEEIQDGIIYYIPMGNLSKSFLTNNIGPKIPIKFKTSGDVISTIESNIKEYGINNAMIEVKVKVSVTMIINMPFVSKEINVKTSLPIVMKIIQGNIPDYYPWKSTQ